jgi:hypothetical protein
MDRPVRCLKILVQIGVISFGRLRAFLSTKWLPGLATIVVIAFIHPLSVMANARALKVARLSARVADDVPVSRLESVVRDPRVARSGQELVERLGIKKLDDLVSYKRNLSRLLSETLPRGSSQLTMELAQEPLAVQEASLVLARGGDVLHKSVGDLAVRSRLLRAGGADLLVTLGRYDDLAEDIVRFDTAALGGKLPSPPGHRSVSLSDLGRFFHDHGERAHHFWTQYVRPHWPLWLGSTALAAVLLAPDEFLDEVGNLTEKGLERIGQVGGKLLGHAMAGAASGMIQGTGEGIKKGLKELVIAIVRTYFTSPLGVITFTIVIFALLCLVRPTRILVFHIFSLLSRKLWKLVNHGYQ